MNVVYLKIINAIEFSRQNGNNRLLEETYEQAEQRNKKIRCAIASDHCFFLLPKGKKGGRGTNARPSRL